MRDRPKHSVANLSRPRVNHGIRSGIATLLVAMLIPAYFAAPASAFMSQPCGAGIGVVSGSSYALSRNRNLRNGPSLDCGIVASLSSGATVTVAGSEVLADGFFWSETSSNGSSGWLATRRQDGSGSVLDSVPVQASPTAAPSNANASESQPESRRSIDCTDLKSFVQSTQTDPTSSLAKVQRTYNARSGPSTACTIVGSYEAGAYVEILRSEGKWRYVRNSQGAAWVHNSAFEGQAPTRAGAPSSPSVPQSAALPAPGPSGSSTNNKSKCERLARKINARVNRIKNRHSDLVRNKHDLPLTGPNSVEGHREAYAKEQRGLRGELIEWNKWECGGRGGPGIPPNAWSHVKEKAPYPTNPGRWNGALRGTRSVPCKKPSKWVLGGAIVIAGVLVIADGPLPLGDAAAAATVGGVITAPCN